MSTSYKKGRLEILRVALLASIEGVRRGVNIFVCEAIHLISADFVDTGIMTRGVNK